MLQNVLLWRAEGWILSMCCLFSCKTGAGNCRPDRRRAPVTDGGPIFGAKIPALGYRNAAMWNDLAGGRSSAGFIKRLSSLGQMIEGCTESAAISAGMLVRVRLQEQDRIRFLM
jgi:hypothetical protein